MPNRFQLRGESLEGIEWRLFNSHGSTARIISAEKVSEGGLGGFFARQFFEVVVEVDDGAAAPEGAAPEGAAQSPGEPGSRRAASAKAKKRTGQRGKSAGIPAESGIDALLQDADDADGSFGSTQAAGEKEFPSVSTASDGFAALLADLATTVPAAATPVTPDAPVLLSGAGKVVMIVGLATDPMDIARSMSRVLKTAEIRTAGAIKAVSVDHVAGRLGLAAARAAGAAGGRTVIVAFGLTPGGHVPSAALSEVGADQIWVVVDAARKQADTAVWVDRVGWAVAADALAVLGSMETLTPGTVHELGLPIGWIDGGPGTGADL
ncbi:hypothetical protein IV500_13050 [Paeniglutamicibacter antarcticus]|uniref:Uncharacterized protein n=1 Tax=Arthrobacter terrae TaxID=2935737 RepID=A0A931G5U4_9MICC|nr:hypothetical protein [Arthrobacter terrae]MBG0740308.1 hypothetical protein [Arthrobacter terrae]